MAPDKKSKSAITSASETTSMRFKEGAPKPKRGGRRVKQTDRVNSKTSPECRDKDDEDMEEEMTSRNKRPPSPSPVREKINKHRRVVLDTLCELEPVSKRSRVISIDHKRVRSQSSDEEAATKRQRIVKIKDIPKFTGEKNEDFDQWRHESLYFMDSLHIPEEDRVNLLIMGLSGVARKLVAKRSNLINQNDLFSSLAAFFKRPGAEVHEALTTKQMQKESVAAFAARLQAKVHDAEISGANGSVDAFLLHLFIENIKPEYATRLKYWGPSTFTAAFESALSYEKECIPPKREKLVFIDENQGQTSADNTALRALQQSIKKLWSQ